MQSTRATVAYGVTIQTAPLLFVALAWPRLRGTLRFFDLVLLRRRSATLVSTSETTSRLPDEVWEEIRSHVVENEVSDSEQNFLAGFVCGECLEESKAGRRRLDWSSFDEILKRCPRDARSFDNWIAKAFCLFVLPEPFRVVQACLSHFDFRLPSPSSMWVECRPEDEGYDGFAFVAISPKSPQRLPTRGRDSVLSQRPPTRTRNSAILQSTSPSAATFAEPSLVELSLQLDPHVDDRFNRFARYFNLKFCRFSHETLRPIYKDVANPRRTSPSSGMSRQPEDSGASEIKPRWMLVLAETD